MKVCKAYRQEGDLLYSKEIRGIIRINGETIKKIDYNDHGVVFHENNKIEDVVENRIIADYRSREDQTKFISPSEYDNTLRDMRLHRAFNDDDGDTVWRDIESRHKYEKFVDLWLPRIETVIEYRPITIDIVGNLHAPLEFVEPIRKISGDLTSTVYQYRISQHVASIVKEVLEENGYESRDFTRTSLFYVPLDATKSFHIQPTGIRDGKILYSEAGGWKFTYLTIAIPYLKKYEGDSNGIRVFNGSFDEVKTKHTQTRNTIRKIVKQWISSFTEFAPTAKTQGEIVQKLKTLNDYYLDCQYTKSIKVITNSRKVC